ncbi:YtxH domain-containing protein [Thermodesulfobacterium sp. TA1]|uniref:YtxH domain-containing protein n=1 Tax=Thermodesulfobacterium sp. TA1 TaxID=2234087 RepID=UPI001231B7D5|nr:YtxH domain-containing protein [Thermodesulfobacterium sp. TA1]QER42889.1 YtxH domain-containing protein [Thermodesulfobacterium sp. TA1]
MEGKKTAVLVAFLGGVIVGGIAAILLAPASGAEVRKKIKEEVDEAIEKVKTEAETLKSKAEEITSKAKEVLEAKKEEVKEAIEKSKETLKEKKEELASKLLKKEEV